MKKGIENDTRTHTLLAMLDTDGLTASGSAIGYFIVEPARLCEMAQCIACITRVYVCVCVRLHMAHRQMGPEICMCYKHTHAHRQTSFFGCVLLESRERRASIIKSAYKLRLCNSSVFSRFTHIESVISDGNATRERSPLTNGLEKQRPVFPKFWHNTEN